MYLLISLSCLLSLSCENKRSLKPIGLNCLLNTDVSSKKESEKPNFYQLKRLKLNNLGKVELAKQIHLEYVGRCIGFQDEALKTFAVRRTVYSFITKHSSLHRHKREAEVPTMVSIFLEETNSGPIFFFSAFAQQEGKAG